MDMAKANLAVRGALLGALIAAGCGGAGSKPVNLDDLFSRVYGTFCKYEVACDAMPDMATCLDATQNARNYIATLKQDIASGKVKYDAAKAGACVDLVERVYGTGCSRTAIAANSDRSGNACADMLAGTVPDGGVCYFSLECANGGSCYQTDTSCSSWLQCCSGACQGTTTPIVPVGGKCSSTDRCAGDAYCDTSVSGVTGTCKLPSAGEGAACADETSCAPPLYCDLDPTAGMGTCRRPAATGEACADGFGFIVCDDVRDYCDPSSLTCARRAGIGASCSSSQACIDYAECDGMTCLALPKPGEACRGGSCLGTAKCDGASGYCTVPSSGDACI
jgi:hypothetical protein